MTKKYTLGFTDSESRTLDLRALHGLDELDIETTECFVSGWKGKFNDHVRVRID